MPNIETPEVPQANIDTAQATYETENRFQSDDFVMKVNFEAEKFCSNIIHGAKIEALEKQLQQVLYENHNLRRQMSKMNYMVGSLVKVVKKSFKLYLGER